MSEEPWDASITSISQRNRGAKDQVEMIAMLCFFCFSRMPNKLEYLFRTGFVEILDRCKGIALRYSPR